MHALPEVVIDDWWRRIWNLDVLVRRALDHTCPPTCSRGTHAHALRSAVHRSADVYLVEEHSPDSDRVPAAPHKHAKTNRLDSRLLARLPLLHPEGLHDEHGRGPGDPLRRATRLRQSLVQGRTKSQARLDALLELLGPKWLKAFGERLANKTRSVSSQPDTPVPTR